MTNAVDIAAVASYVNSNGVNSISTTSGALTVAGGVGITGNTYIGGTINGAGTGLTGTATSLAIGGNAGTATILQTARSINGVSFNGSADITVTAAAGTLTGTTLNSTVVTSSLTSVGTITTGVWNAGAITSSGQIRSSSNFISTSTGPATTGQFAAVSGTTFVSLYNDGTSAYILKSATSSTAFDTGRPFYFNLSSGAVTLDGTGAGITTGGFMGVGIAASSGYKLDVGGKGRFLQDAAATTGAVILRSNSGNSVGGHLQWVNNANTDELGYIAINPSKVMTIATAGQIGLTMTGGSVGMAGITTPLAQLDVGGVLSHSVIYTNKTFTSGSWYRFLTLNASNAGQTVTAILRNINGHDSVEIKLSKHTVGSSSLGYIAEVRRLGSFAYTYNIVKLRICDDGTNAATHVEVQFGSGNPTSAMQLLMTGAMRSGGFATPDMTTGTAGVSTTKEIFISDGVSGTNNQTVLGFSTASSDLFYIKGNGNVGVGTSSPTYNLQVNGSFAATTKSFVIDHPTKPDMKLRYGSLEGPENGVYVRGRLLGNNVIDLPDYWTGLVDENSITVNLTPISKFQELYVAEISNNRVIVGGVNFVDCFYTVFAERKDVDKMIVEFNGRMDQ